ncbi:MAG: caspase family protein, partial [Myxococcota bacterium]
MLGLMTLMVVVLAPRAVEAQPRTALFVGSNKAPTGLGTLLFAHDDARKMRDVFVELGGVSADRATLLLDPTANELRSALERLSATAGSGQLVFYYSGHADASGLLLGNDRLPSQEVRRFLSRRRLGMRLAIVDACNSGSIARTKGGTLKPGVDIDWTADAQVQGAVLVTSSAAEEASIERDDIGGSLFSHYLISGLRGAADTDEDSKVTLEEAFTYASARTMERSAQSRVGTQHPTYEYRISGQREVVLSWLELPSYLSFGADLA